MSRVIPLVAAVAWLSAVSVAGAQSNPAFVQFSPPAVKGALYRPDTGPAPHVAVLLMHRTSSFLSHPATRELSRRGFLVLGMSSRAENNEAAVRWEDLALDLKSGIEFLRRQPGITKVVLLGHSGGGPLSSFYQAVAEQGPSHCQGPSKLVQCGNALRALPRADGIILMDAHPGMAVNALRSLNPAVVSEGHPSPIDPQVDPHSAANGYTSAGAATYSDDFKERYFRAQAARMNRLIDAALEKKRHMAAGTAPFADDDVFVIVRGEGGRLAHMDVAVDAGTFKPQKLLKNDGSVATAIIRGVRRPIPGTKELDASFERGARLLTVQSFLSANAIRATHSMTDVDWCSSNSSTPCGLRAISVPLLIAASGAHYFIRDSELHYEMAGSKDKDFIVVEGATHGMTGCTACEQRPGQYANAEKNFYDYVAKWLGARF